jgi:FMN-dependent NADH-azoreductase
VAAWHDVIGSRRVDGMMRAAHASGWSLAGRPLALVVARGGGYGPGTPREGWDHATPWLQRIFGDVFGMDVQLISAELTLADVNPAMAGLRDLAAQSRRDAHALAEATGRDLAGRAGRSA